MTRLTRRHALRQLAGMFGAGAFAQTGEPLLEPANVFDFMPLAKAKLDPIAWDYLEGGSEDEVSLRDNREGFNRIVIRPRALVDVHKIDLSLELFGLRLDYPILLDPAGGKNCFHADGENLVAAAAAKAKALHITNGGIQKLVEAGKGPVHFQLTTGGELRNTQTMRAFVKRLESSGCSGICFTTDIMYVSHRERNIHNRFERRWCETGVPPRDAQGKLPRSPNPEQAAQYPERPFPTPTWATVKELRQLTKLPILLKGILTKEDAQRAVEAGMSGVIVSNHGARQLDHVGGTIEALPEVVEGAAGRIPVLIDGGFRRGTDILKALALGAKAICIARPYLYGLAAFGGPGVERVLELLRTELALDMGLAGVPNLPAIDRGLVRIRGGNFR
ncbi:MAG: alpha-hydroxy-acid oxidizing protein [Acidobacteria bacterium]|nr:alpha-hydroxy-acid oxidizing protein [Acidobacteriota bacterium]MBI3470827.1 alpha-hydroxy-acid oxidizing protein [Candidatus Solibacter usitatus]